MQNNSTFQNESFSYFQGIKKSTHKCLRKMYCLLGMTLLYYTKNQTEFN